MHLELLHAALYSHANFQLWDGGWLTIIIIILQLVDWRVTFVCVCVHLLCNQGFMGKLTDKVIG